MALYEVWSEGYAATGERGTATFHGKFKAESFDEAVKQYMQSHPNTVDFDRYGKGIHAIWGCRLFDNESEARKSFG